MTGTASSGTRPPTAAIPAPRPAPDPVWSDRAATDGTDLPIGRRVAHWRTRRGLSQQVFADLLGKSKSWVEKIERGERPLDRLSVISDIAHVLSIDPQLLLHGHPDRGRGAASHPRQTPASGLDTGTARRDVEILINRHLTAGLTRDVRETRLLRRLLTLAYAAMTAEDIPLQVRCRVMATVLSHHEAGRR